jgi:beta-lactamase superfamily II metal-dependent hydrolase
VGNAPDIRAGQLGTSAELKLAANDLAIFFINVGDGDAIVVRFPERAGQVSFAVIDAYRADKTIGLLHALTLPSPAPAPRFRFVCATHPHYDHIAGLPKLLRTFAGQVEEFWDSGFRFSSTSYRSVIEEVEEEALRSGLQFVRPTSGFEIYHDRAMLTVLSPSMALRNRYDTYGVDVNNASIVIRLTYPVKKPSADYPKTTGEPPAGDASTRSTTVILGGDAQTDAWGQILQEFPHLDPDERNWARAIGAKTGRAPLLCDLFKVSHHCSKRGVNLELLERLGDRSTGFPSKGPRYLVSSCASGSSSGYGFPHAVTQDLLREVRDPIAQSGGSHRGDDALGIHYTSQHIDEPGRRPERSRTSWARTAGPPCIGWETARSTASSWVRRARFARKGSSA